METLDKSISATDTAMENLQTQQKSIADVSKSIRSRLYKLEQSDEKTQEYLKTNVPANVGELLNSSRRNKVLPVDTAIQSID